MSKKAKTARHERDRQAHLRRRWNAMLGCSLEQLDGRRWGEPEFDSYVVRTCHALRRKPIGKLTVCRYAAG
jgi:hypothetical protein